MNTDLTSLKPKINTLFQNVFENMKFNIKFEQECDSIHDKLGEIGQGTIDNFVKSTTLRTDIQEKRKTYKETGEDLFFEILLNEYPQLESRINYITPDQLDFVDKKVKKVDVPLCGDSNRPFNLYSIFDAGKMPNVPIALSLSTFIDSASSPDNPTQYENETIFSITDYAVGFKIVEELQLSSHIILKDHSENVNVPSVYTNIGCNLLWQLTLYYCFRSRGNTSTRYKAFLTAIYILSHVRFQLNRNNTKKMDYYFTPDEREYNDNRILQHTLYNAFQNELLETITNELKTQSSLHSALYEELHKNVSIISMTGRWNEFTNTISKGNCRKYVQSVGIRLPNISKEHNPVTSTIFGEIDAFCIQFTNDNINMDISDKYIKLYIGQILKYSGDTSHILCRTLMSRITPYKSKKPQCSSTATNNVFSILTIDRLLAVRSMINSKSNEGVLLPLYRPLQTTRFNDWYNQLDVTKQNLYPKSKCYCHYIHKELTYRGYLNDVENTIDILNTPFKEGFVFVLKRSSYFTWDNNDKLSGFNNIQPNQLNTTILEPNLTILNDVLTEAKFYEKIQDNIKILNSSYRVSKSFPQILSNLNKLVFKTGRIRGDQIFNRKIASNTTKGTDLPNEYYYEIENLELYYNKYISYLFFIQNTNYEAFPYLNTYITQNLDILPPKLKGPIIQVLSNTVNNNTTILHETIELKEMKTQLRKYIHANTIRLTKLFLNSDGVSMYTPIRYPMENARIEFIDRIITTIINILKKTGLEHEIFQNGSGSSTNDDNTIMVSGNEVTSMTTSHSNPNLTNDDIVDALKTNPSLSPDPYTPNIYLYIVNLERTLHYRFIPSYGGIDDETTENYRLYLSIVLSKRKTNMYKNLINTIEPFKHDIKRYQTNIIFMVHSLFNQIIIDEKIFGDTFNRILNNIHDYFKKTLLEEIENNSLELFEILKQTFETIHRRRHQTNNTLFHWEFLVNFEIIVLQNAYAKQKLPEELTHYIKKIETFTTEYVSNILPKPLFHIDREGNISGFNRTNFEKFYDMLIGIRMNSLEGNNTNVNLDTDNLLNQIDAFILRLEDYDIKNGGRLKLINFDNMLNPSIYRIQLQYQQMEKHKEQLSYMLNWLKRNKTVKIQPQSTILNHINQSVHRIDAMKKSINNLQSRIHTNSMNNELSNVTLSVHELLKNIHQEKEQLQLLDFLMMDDDIGKLKILQKINMTGKARAYKYKRNTKKKKDKKKKIKNYTSKSKRNRTRKPIRNYSRKKNQPKKATHKKRNKKHSNNKKMFKFKI
jgi:hypothetical protein